VLTNIVIGPGLLVHVSPLESGVRQVLLVEAPAYSRGVQEINDCFRIGTDSLETIVHNVVGARAAGCNVVWLRWVCYRVVVVEEDTFLCEVGQVGYQLGLAWQARC